MTRSHVSALLDAALAERVLVFGSLPPGGRDLDLLVPSGKQDEIWTELRGLGFVEIGGSAVLFRDCTAYDVGLETTGSWGLSKDAAERLFSQARDIPGYRNLMRPSAAHSLLILARRVRKGAALDAKKLERVAGWLSEDPLAWSSAEREAPAWGLAEDLGQLRRAVQGSATPDAVTAGAVLRRRAGTIVRKVTGRAPGGVISLSGLDGSGKSTQAEHLREALIALGADTVIEWTKIARDPSLAAVARPVKKLIGLLPSKAIPEVPPDDDPDAHLRHHPDGPRPAPDSGARLRQRNRVLTQGWTFVVAVANASTHRRTVKEHLRSGRVVICDRYVLDSRAHLRYRYGTGQRFRLQTAVIRWLSPRPVRSYLLDVAPLTARERKPEQYTVRDLERLRTLYIEEVERIGARPVDAEREIELTCADLAEDAWRALTARRER